MCRGGLKDNWVCITALLVFSCFFVLVYSTSTSPLYPYPGTCDSFIFQLIGKEWLSGSIPYKDLYDNKGPLLYAMNALGYWLLSVRSGIVIIQTVFLFATAVVTFWFLRIGFGKKSSLWLTIVLLLGLSLGYNCGNNACEYAMPWIVYAFYLFYKWLEQDEQTKAKTSLCYHFVYGVALGFCLMTRASNGLVVLMVAAYVFVYCLAKRQIKGLLANMAAMTAGVLIVCLPFVIYFLSKNSLEDFYYATFISNMHYLKNTGLWVSPMYLKRAIALICSYFNCLSFIIVGLLVIFRKNRRKMGLAWFAMSMLCVVFFVRTNCYPNYAHICLPFAVIGLLELKNIIKDVRSSRLLRMFSMAVSLLIIGINSFNGAYSLVKNAINDDSSQRALYKAYDSLLESIPEDGLRSFASYECLPEILLRWNIHPSYRFFALQGFSCDYNQDVYEKTIDEFVHGEAQWIMVNYWKGLPSGISKTLDERYVPEKSTNEGEVTLVLYKKRSAGGVSD